MSWRMEAALTRIVDNLTFRARAAHSYNHFVLEGLVRRGLIERRPFRYVTPTSLAYAWRTQ